MDRFEGWCTDLLAGDLPMRAAPCWTGYRLIKHTANCRPAMYLLVQFMWCMACMACTSASICRITVLSSP